MSNDKDFIIKDGAIKKYKGKDKEAIVPDGVTKIGRWAFLDCTFLVSIIIPDSVIEIGDNAFGHCTALTSITIPYGVTKIGSITFAGCISLKSITIPNGVAEIGDGAFSYCRSLANIAIPESVSKIGSSAFKHCTSLTNITFPNRVKTIENDAFSGCSSLTNITIPNSVTKIGDSAFSGCTSLTRIVIPDSITEIGKYAFAGSNISRIHIGNISLLSNEAKPSAILEFLEAMDEYTTEQKDAYIKYIKRNAEKLMSVFVENSDALAIVCREKLIPAKNAAAYLEAAQKCGKAESVALMIDYCTNKISTTEKERVANKKKNVEEAVLTRIVARQDKVDIDGLTFAISGKIETFVNRNEMKEFIESRGGKVASSLSAKVDYLITNGQDTDREKINKAKEYGVEIITEQQFNEKANRLFIIKNNVLQKYIGAGGIANIPEGITEIAEFAFSRCAALVRVVIPGSVIKIGSSAFLGCTSLESVTAPADVKFGAGAFGGCTNLADENGFIVVNDVLLDYVGKSEIIEIPKSVKTIGESAFESCKFITSVMVSESVTQIKAWAFSDCTHLTSITLPMSVTIIEGHAFHDCFFLNNITLSNSKTKIRKMAFYNCSNLTIHAPAGSYAEKYAKENNIPFVAE